MREVKCLYVLIAKDITTDTNDGMNTIIKIVDVFNVNVNHDELKKQGITFGDQSIVIPTPYSVGTSWLFDKNTTEKGKLITFRITIIDQEGKKHPGPSQEHEIPSQHTRINVNFVVNGLPISGEGNYTLIVESISKAGKVLGSGEYPYIVKFQDILTAN